MSSNTIAWLESTGGPLLLLRKGLVPFWHGFLPTHGSVMTDYDRACEVEDYLGNISVESGQGLVLGDEPLRTTWWQSDNFGVGLIVRWVYAENEAEIIKSLDPLLSNAWEPTDVRLGVSHEELVLFDSACPGNDLDVCLKIRIPSGTYAAETLLYNPNEQTSLLLHRFVAISSA